MKRLLMLALLVSVFSASMSAQVSGESWTKKYDSEMNLYADVHIHNETFKTISTAVFQVTAYDIYGEGSREAVIDCKIYPYMNGHVCIPLVPYGHEQPEINYRIKLLKVRYSNGSIDNINHSIPEK